MPNRLIPQYINRVALVDAGANPRAKVVMVKRLGEMLVKQADNEELSDEDLADLRDLTWNLVTSGRLDPNEVSELYGWHRWAEAMLGIDGPDEANDDDEEQEEDMAAKDKIEAAAKRFIDADPLLTREQAFARALDTAEGAALYDEHRAEQRPAFRKLLEDETPNYIEKIAKGEELSASDRLEAVARSIARRDGITYEQALSQHLSTPEGIKIYEASKGR